MVQLVLGMSELPRPEVLQYFIYALEKEKADPIAFLSTPVDLARKQRLFAGTRNLWCAAVFEWLGLRGNWISSNLLVEVTRAEQSSTAPQWSPDGR